jgi:ElaA protein
MTTTLSWQLARFRNLDVDALYDLLALRADVFVVEQRCAYADLDGKDRHPDAQHLLARDTDGALVAYLRMLPPGVSFDEASFGRVVTAPSQRGRGLGDALVTEALKHMARIWPGIDIRIGAQAHLVGYYGKHGFVIASDEYLEDDIPHRDMLRRAV